MRKPNPRPVHPPALPDRSSNPWRGLSDADRRSFLKQLAAGSGALCLSGVGRMAGADELPIDFTRLDHHLSVEALAPADAQAEEAAEAEPDEADSLSEQADSEVDEDGAPIAETERAEAAVTELVENRAIWVEPGYLILLRWRRDEADPRPVDAIPAATAAAQTFLQGRVTSVDQLHNIDQLHVIEAELSALLEAALAPAHIEVLHLDHDCRTVCSALDPSRSYPEPSMVDGEMSSPGWE